MKIYVLHRWEWYFDEFGCQCPRYEYTEDAIGYYSSEKNAQEALKKAIEMIKSSNNGSRPWHADVLEGKTQLFTANQEYIDLWITEVELDSEPNLEH